MFSMHTTGWQHLRAFLNAKKTAQKKVDPYLPYTTWNTKVYLDTMNSWLSPSQKFWGMEGFEHNGSLNLLKGGIQHADKPYDGFGPPIRNKLLNSVVAGVQP